MLGERRGVRMKPKFRFFGRVADGEMRMVYPGSIDFEDGYIYYSYRGYTAEGDEYVDGDVTSFEDCVLMQSTGLKDKNGKEIYDGDIVRFTLTDGFSYVVDEFGTVKYKLGAFYILNGLTEYLISDIHIDDIEVVGNIWENPELLDGEWIDSLYALWYNRYISRWEALLIIHG